MIKIVKNPGNGRSNNLNDPVLDVLSDGEEINRAWENIKDNKKKPQLNRVWVGMN